MKTSNKLIMLLSVFFTATLVLFNLLLNAQLKKGHITSEKKPAARTSVPLAPFRHLVFEGRMMLNQSRNYTGWQEHGIQLSSADKCSLEIPADQKSDLDYRYEGDTLFISFTRKNKKFGREVRQYQSLPLQLFSTGLASVTAHFGNITLHEYEQQEKMDLYVNNGNKAWLSDTHLPMLEIHADTNSTVTVTSGGVVDTLAFSLKNSSFLTFNSPMNIKTILPVQSDASSKIKMEGKAVDMHVYLQQTK